MSHARMLLLLSIAGSAIAQDRPASDEPLPAGAVRQLGTAAYRLDGNVWDISPDGKWLVGGSYGNIVLMEFETGRVIRRITIENPGDSEHSVRFTSDSERLRILSDHTIQTWTLNPWKRVGIIKLADDETSRAPMHLASAELWIGKRASEPHDPLEAIDVLSGKVRFRFREIYCLNADGDLAAFCQERAKDQKEVADAPSIIAVLNLTSGRTVARIRTEIADLNQLALTNDAKYLAIAGQWVIEIWDLGTGKAQWTWPASSETRIVFARDGRTLLAVTPNGIQSWDVVTGKRHASTWTRRPRESVTWGVLKPLPGNRVVGVRDRLAGFAELWDIAAGKMLNRLSGHPAEVESLAFIPGRQELLSASADCPILRWDTSSGKLLGNGLESRDGSPLPDWPLVFSAPAISPTGRFALVPVHYRGDVGVGQTLWDLRNMECVEQEFLAGINRGSRHRTFSADDRLLAFVDAPLHNLHRNGSIRLLNLQSGRPTPGLPLTGRYAALAISPSGKRLAAVEYNELKDATSLSIWDLNTGRRLNTHAISKRHFCDSIFLTDRRLLLLEYRDDRQPDTVVSVVDTLAGRSTDWPCERLELSSECLRACWENSLESVDRSRVVSGA